MKRLLFMVPSSPLKHCARIKNHMYTLLFHVSAIKIDKIPYPHPHYYSNLMLALDSVGFHLFTGKMLNTSSNLVSFTGKPFALFS